MKKQTRKFFYGLILMVVAIVLIIIENGSYMSGSYFWHVVRIVSYAAVFVNGLNKIQQTAQ